MIDAAIQFVTSDAKINFLMLVAFVAGCTFGACAAYDIGRERGRRDMDAQWRKAEWR